MTAVNSQSGNINSSAPSLRDLQKASSNSFIAAKPTDLHEWVLNGCESKCPREQLESQINSVESNGCTPLMLAIKNNALQKAHFLIAQGADVNICDPRGKNALHYAAKISGPKLFAEILQKTKDINTHCSRGHTALFYAVKKNRVENVKELIQQNVNTREHAHAQVLLSEYAQSKGYTEVSELLVTAQDDQVYNKIVGSIKGNDITKALPLIEHLKNIDFQEKDGNTLLHQAVLQGNEEVSKLLIEIGANVNVQDENGRTPLQIACMHKRDDMVQILLDAGALPKLKDNRSWTALHYAASQESNASIIRLLVANCAELIDEQDINYTTPLHIAAKKRYLENVEILLAYNADCDLQDIHGATALHLAISDDDEIENDDSDEENDGTDIVKELIQHGCDQNIKNDKGDTALMTACRAGSNLEIIFELSSNSDLINDTNNIVNKSPLMIAVCQEEFEIAEYLLERGADPVLTDCNLDTPLHMAALSNSPNGSSLAKALIACGADCNVRNQKETTPLGNAIYMGNLEFIKILLESSSDRAALCYDGVDAVSIAKELCQKEILKELVQAGFEDFQQSGRNLVFHNEFHEKFWQPFIATILGITCKNDEDMEFNIEGSHTSIIYPSTAYALEQFSKKTPASFLNWEDIAKTVIEGFDGTRCDKKVDFLAAGTPIIVPTGWDGHSVVVLLYDRYLFICNRGERSSTYKTTPSVITFRVDPTKITPEDIETVYKSTYTYDREDGSKFLYESLAEKWSPDALSETEKKESAEFIDCIQKLTTFSRTQKHNNCTKANLFLGIYLLMLCYHHKNTKTLNVANTEIRKLYKDATNFVKKFYAAHYLSREHHSKDEVSKGSKQFQLLVKNKLKS